MIDAFDGGLLAFLLLPAGRAASGPGRQHRCIRAVRMAL
jgi:hypothetical protein